MRVLLTGASGFIGARVVRELQRRGHEVAALVEPGDPMRRLAGMPELRRIEGALESIAAAREPIAAFSPEGCIHLAWYAEPGKYLHSERNLGCLAGSLALLRLLEEIGCRRVVMAGTCAEYHLDTRELLREDARTNPETLYAACKLSLGLIGQQMAVLGGYTFAWGRVFYLYGPDEDPRRAIPAVARAMIDDRSFDASAGTQLRDYLHADDVAAGFVTLVEKAATGAYNVCSGRPLPMREIMAMVQRAAGSGRINFGAVAPRGWDPPFVGGDNSRLRALGWEPRIALEEGLRGIVAELRRAA